MRLLYILVILSFSYTLRGQNNNEITTFINQNTNQITALGEGGAFFIGQRQKMIDIEGSILLNEAWQESVVLSKDGKRAKCQARYQFYSDEVQVLIDENIGAFQPGRIQAIAIGNQIFLSAAFVKNNAFTEGFFEILEEGKLTLLLRREGDLKRSDYNPALNTGQKHDQIIILETLYYYDKSNIAQKLKKRKKDILALMPDQKETVSTYIKKEKLSIKKQEDLIKIFKFYNSLNE